MCCLHDPLDSQLGGFLGGAAVELFLGGKQRVPTDGVVVLKDNPP